MGRQAEELFHVAHLGGGRDRRFVGSDGADVGP